MSEPAPDHALRGYALCAIGRSGSSWFAALLTSTGDLGRPADAFNTGFQRRLLGPDYPADRAAQMRYVREAGATPNGIYGVKVFPPHLERVSRHLNWTEHLPGLRFIHWRRRDLLGLAISRHRGLATRQWRSTLVPQGEARYDGEAILEALRWAVLQEARWAMFFARTGLAPLRLDYEDVLADPQAAVDAVSAFMGLATRPRIDLSAVKLDVQRDAVTEAWRRRFIDAYGTPDVIGTF